MKIEGEAQRVRVYVGENDTWHGKPLFEAIVLRAREEGLAGATVFRGMEGYGASSRVHTTRLLERSRDLPVVIELIDVDERIARFLPMIEEMVDNGLVTTEAVHAVAYRGTAVDG